MLSACSPHCRRNRLSPTSTQHFIPSTICLLKYVFFLLLTEPYLSAQAGTVGEQGVIMPVPLPLTSERLERHGLYLIEDGQTIFLWVGRDAVPQLVMDVFNLPSYEVLRGGKVSP